MAIFKLLTAQMSNKMNLLMSQKTSKLWSVRTAATMNDIPKAPYIPFFNLGNGPFIGLAGGPTLFHKFVDNNHKKYGRIYLDNMEGEKTVFLADAESNLKVYDNESEYPMHATPAPWKKHMEISGEERGLFFMDGPEWLRARRIVNRHILKLKATDSYIERVVECSNKFLDIWENNPPGKKLDYHLYIWIVECTVRICFGSNFGFLNCLTDTHKRNELNDEFLDGVYTIFTESSNLMNQPLGLASKFNSKSWTNFTKASSGNLKIARYFVDEGMKALSLPNPSEEAKNSVLYKLIVEEKMDKHQATHIIADLILAAADTTAYNAIFALHLLGRDKKQRDLARQEVRKALEESNGVMDENFLSKITYVKCILKETLRLYPVASFLTRKIAHDINLLGYNIEAGTLILTSLYTMFRDKEYFTNPNKFIPERWIRSSSKFLIPVERPIEITEHNSRCYLPFSIGIRSCIGKRFAEMEMQIFISTALLKYDWTTDNDVDLVQKIILVPSKEVILNLKKL